MLFARQFKINLNGISNARIRLNLWTSVVFLLLIFLLKKFAWSPILKAVDDRNKSIDEALSSAEKAKAEMEQLSANNEKILHEARIERDSIIKEARAIKENTISEAKAKHLGKLRK